MKLVTAEQMREIDRVSIEELGIPGISLMEAAGRAVALDVANYFPKGTIAILCGKGNNGGDGFVAARYLHQAGWRVEVYFVEEPAENGGDAREAWVRMPSEINRLRFDEVADLADRLPEYEAAIDALLGTGAKGRPRPPYDTIIRELNQARIPVFAVDIPSGLDPNKGTADLAVRAFRTITMGLPKIGMVSAQGPEYCGAIRVEPLGFPQEVIDAAPSESFTLSTPEAAALLPERPRDGHKGTFGLVLIAAGSRFMPGAAVLCATGAMRSGCGLVRMLAPISVNRIIMNHCPEVLLSEGCAEEQALRPLNKDELEHALHRATAIVAGPGMTTGPGSEGLVSQLLQVPGLPAVVDADALTILSQNKEIRKLLQPRHILTPHPGELARLLDRSIGAIQKDRWGCAREAARELGCVVVLKGSGTIVAEPGGRATHIPSGNSALARGGAGDVLAGMMGSLLAQGCKPSDAAGLATFVHGLAADIYTRGKSARGATVSELATMLPEAFGELEDTASALPPAR